jgi:hypothetical protein
VTDVVTAQHPTGGDQRKERLNVLPDFLLRVLGVDEQQGDGFVQCRHIVTPTHPMSDNVAPGEPLNVRRPLGKYVALIRKLRRDLTR